MSLALRRHKGAVQPPKYVWEREWNNFFKHTSAEITSADYQSAGGSIVNPDVDGPPGFEEYNVVSICDDGITFSNLYNPGSINSVTPPVGDLMMSWYMKREDGGVCSVGTNSATGSCYTRIYSASSPADQVGAEAVGGGWYRGWCTAYGLITGSSVNTGLLRSATQYSNDNGKLYVTCFQLEAVRPGIVDETTGPSPFRPTTDWAGLWGERKRLRSSQVWTPADPVTNIVPYSNLFADVARWEENQAAADESTKYAVHDGRVIPLTAFNSDGVAAAGAVFLKGLTNTTFETNKTYTATIYVAPGTSSWFTASIVSLGSLSLSAYINASDGSIGTLGADVISATSTYVGLGVYRLQFTFPSDVSDTTGQWRLYAAEGDNDLSWADRSGAGLYIGGLQVEEGSTASPYVDNPGATNVSRSFGSNVIYLNKGAVQLSKFNVGFNIGSSLIGGRRLHDWRGASPTGWPEVTRGRPQ